MSLPNFSYLASVGQLRYVQAQCESPENRNPDTAVGGLLTVAQRVNSMLRGKMFLPRLRAKPFYYYILARTRYYDGVFLSAVSDSVGCIVNIGAGSDTRAYRFAPELKQKGIRVIECDQPQAIVAKEKAARRQWATDHVTYLPLDLNHPASPEFAGVLGELRQKPILVMMEGVSPYVRRESFAAFLRLLTEIIHPQSMIAYDFKVAGVAEDFGRSSHVTSPFRLSAVRAEVAAYHQALGLRLRHMELSVDLTRRLVPNTPALFGEDCLLRLEVCEPRAP